MANKFVVSDDEDELESVDAVICMKATTPARFDDDVYDFCCVCGEKVRMRPYVPKVPKKMCLECALPKLKAEAKKGELTHIINPKVISDIKKTKG